MNKRVLSLFLVIVMIFNYIEPVMILAKEKSTIEGNEEYVNIKLWSNKYEYNAGEEFPLYVNISPEEIEQSVIRPKTDKKKIVILFDTSASMTQNRICGQTRLDIAQTACNGFLEKLNSEEGTEVALIPFSTCAYETYKDNRNHLPLGFTNNIESIKDYVKNLESEYNRYAFEGTNIGDAIRIANSLFLDEDINEDEKYMILFTDGFPTAFTTSNFQDYPYIKCGGLVNIQNIYNAKRKVNKDNWGYKYYEYQYTGKNNKNIVAYTGDMDIENNSLKYAAEMAEVTKRLGVKSSVIGFTNGVNHNRLMKITNTLNGNYYVAKNKNSLDIVFDEIKEKTINTIEFMDITLSINHKGFQVTHSSYEKTTNWDMTTINIPKMILRLDSLTGKYVGKPKNIELRLKAQGVNNEVTKSVIGHINYKDFKGKNRSKYTNKEINIKPIVPSNLMEMTMRIPKNDYKNGEDIEIEIDMSSKTIQVEESNSKKKQVAILFDTSGSMNYKMSTEERKHTEIWPYCERCYFEKIPYDSQRWRVGDAYACDSHKECYQWVCYEYSKIEWVSMGEGAGYYKDVMCKAWDWKRKCNINHGNAHRRIEVAKNKTTALINSFATLENIEFALIPFSNAAVTKSDNINNVFENAQDVNERIKGLSANGATNIGDALRVASHVFDENAEKYLILITDGDPTQYSYVNKKTKSKEEYFSECPLLGYYDYYYRGNKINNRNEFKIGGEGNGDTRGESLRYAELSGGLCKDQKIKSYVVGFANDIQTKNITAISRSLNAEKFRATDERALANVINKISKTISQTIKMPTTVTINVPKGLKLPNNSSFIMDKSRNITVPTELVYRLNADTNEYVCEKKSINLKLISDIEEKDLPAYPSIKGTATYKDLKGMVETTEASLNLRILRNFKTEYLKLDTTVLEKAILNTGFYAYNKITPMKIPLSEIGVKDQEIILKNIQVVIESTDNLACVDCKKYGFDLIDGNYYGFIEEIKYKYDEGTKSYKVKEPINIPIKFKGTSIGMGKITISLICKENEGKIIRSSKDIEIIDFHKISATQAMSKSNIDMEEEFQIKYELRGMVFKPNDNEDTADKVIRSIKLQLEPPLGVQILSAEVGEDNTVDLGDITFIKDQEGKYRPVQEVFTEVLDYKLLGGNSGEKLIFKGRVFYDDFNNTKKTIELNPASIDVAFDPPKLSLYLSSSSTYNSLTIQNLDKECEVAVYDTKGNKLTEDKRLTEFKGEGDNTSIQFNKLPEDYVVVRATRDRKNYIEEKVPVIKLGEVEFKNIKEIKENNKISTYRQTDLHVIVPTGVKVDKISVDKSGYKLYETIPNYTVSNNIYVSENALMKDGTNTVIIEGSHNGNQSKYITDIKVDAIVPKAIIKESEDKKDLIITFDEGVQNTFQIKVKLEGNVEMILNQYDMQPYIKQINSDSTGVKSVIIQISGIIKNHSNQVEKREKNVVLTGYKDLSGNVGKEVNHIISNTNNPKIYIVATDIKINGKSTDKNGITVVKDLELNVDAKLRVVYQGQLDIVVYGHKDIRLYDFKIYDWENRELRLIRLNSKNKETMTYEFKSLDMNEDEAIYTLRFVAKIPKNSEMLSTLTEAENTKESKQKNINIEIKGNNLPSNHEKNPRSAKIKLNVLDIDLE